MAVEVTEEIRPMSRQKKVTITVISAFLLALMVFGIYSWWSGRHFRQALAMVNQDVNFEELTPEDRKSRFETYRKLEKNLTREQRGQLDEARERQFEKRDMQRLNTFFAMPYGDQNKKLVAEIQQEEKRRKEWEDKRAQFQKNNPNANNKRAQGGPPQGGGKGGPPQQAGTKGTMSPEARNKRTSDRLDNSSPEYRAARDEYRKRRDQIRTQMGLANSGGGRPGGGPPGGGGGGGKGGAGGGRPGGKG